MADRADVLAALSIHFGFQRFKPLQEEVIMSVLQGEDVFVLMPTGGGKSLCYQLPALMSEGTAIVVSPLIALMKNQVDAIRYTCDNNGVAHVINSTLSRRDLQFVKEDILSGITKLLYIAPESLNKPEIREFLSSVQISFYAIDEAHCISEWGHDFRPEYRRLRTLIDEIGRRPVMALTATATEKVRAEIIHSLGIQECRIFSTSFNRAGLFYEVRPKNENIDRDIIRYIKQHPGQPGIIYCLSRKKVEEVAEMLSINDISCLPYHAGLEAGRRVANQDAFLRDKVQVIVATIAFGMGIDKPDIRFVIHYDISKSLEGYYQETGRGGRDGAGADCICFFSRNDMRRLEKLLHTKTAPEQRIGRHLLRETALYAESSLCRRRLLLHYFGEEFGEDECGCCDNCQNPVPAHDGRKEVAVVLEAVLSAGGHISREDLMRLLIGHGPDDIGANDDSENKLFGVFRNSGERFCKSLILQCELLGFLKKDINDFNILSLTDKGREFLLSPYSVMIYKEREMTEGNNSVFDHQAGKSVLDPGLLVILKDLRRKIARNLDIPPYVVFQETALEAMATIYPLTSEELGAIPGVGPGKVRRFGEDVLRLIKDHIRNNEIVPPGEILVRSMPKRNDLRIAVIKAIDLKRDLAELAREKDLEFDELMEIIEGIVESGIRIDLRYYLDQLIETDFQQEMFDFFRSQEEDNLNEAYAEFSDEVDEEIIRLMRIRFLSELGN